MAIPNTTIHIVGAGLAGSECAYQLAEFGFHVKLYEMRTTGLMTAAHKSQNFAELVCSNSFGSLTDYSAPGQLKWEAEALGSLILKCARLAQVPAGMALGVDREVFAQAVSENIRRHPRIDIVDKVVESLDELPRPLVVATGPLTESRLAESLRRHFDEEFLYFFDAIAPVIDADSIDMYTAFRADRFNKGTKDYLNCGLDREQYYALVEAIRDARKIEPKEFEKTPYFEGCMPIEAMIERGLETPRFGPMSPKGIKNPASGRAYYAVVQLRQENRAATAYNMVGFQTKMAYGEQSRVFRMIPGLEKAEFLKLGSMHRNLYIQSPKKLSPVLASRKDPDLFFAGQMTGVEGYFESTCTGLMVAHFLRDRLLGRPISRPPMESAFGALLNAITEDFEDFQPTNINFSLFPPLMDGTEAKGSELNGDDHSAHQPKPIKKPKKMDKQMKRELQLDRAKLALTNWLIHKARVEKLTDSSPSALELN